LYHRYVTAHTVHATICHCRCVLCLVSVENSDSGGEHSESVDHNGEHVVEIDHVTRPRPLGWL